MEEQKSAEKKSVATLGGGCFWCLQPMFEKLVGVEKVEAGYSAGTAVNPTYQQVCTGKTGHAEVIQIVFSPEVISFKEILEIFLTMHDPTTPNRQGADVGTQYRSVILYHDEEQKRTAESVIQSVEKQRLYNARIVTEVVPFQAFYRAEEYHQDYYSKNPEQGYCRIVVEPKVTKFRQKYSAIFKSSDGN